MIEQLKHSVCETDWVLNPGSAVWLAVLSWESQRTLCSLKVLVTRIGQATVPT